MTPDEALKALRDKENPARAAQMRAYHKFDRVYLGLSNGTVGEMATAWRKATDISARVGLARGLWDSDVFEARIAAGKLFVQARMRPDDQAAWDWICEVVPEFDSWAIADAVAQSGQKRVTQDPKRLETLEEWTSSPHLWTRRAALVFALPFCKSRHPSPVEMAARGRVLGWMGRLSQDPEWFIQKACAWWLRDLSKRAPDQVLEFLQSPENALKPWAVREASKYLPKD